MSSSHTAVFVIKCGSCFLIRRVHMYADRKQLFGNWGQKNFQEDKLFEDWLSLFSMLPGYVNIVYTYDKIIKLHSNTTRKISHVKRIVSFFSEYIQSFSSTKPIELLLTMYIDCFRNCFRSRECGMAHRTCQTFSVVGSVYNCLILTVEKICLCCPVKYGTT